KHYCPNDESCPPQVLGRIEHFVSKRAMDIDSMGTERIRALIDQGFIIDPADIYALEARKEEPLGLEMSQGQYETEGDGLLYIKLEEALVALTEQIPFKLIYDFLIENTELPLTETLKAFQDQIRKWK